MKLFVATKAFIVREGKILILRESGKYEEGTNVGKYDVVGGRVEPGQRFDESLLREVREETGLEVRVGSPFFVNEWRPVIKGETCQIVGIYFECSATSGEVKLSQDHDDYKWIHPNEYQSFHIIDAAKKAFEEYLKKQG